MYIFPCTTQVLRGVETPPKGTRVVEKALIGVSGSAVLLGECRGSVRRTSSSGSTLEAHRSKRCDHCLDEGAVAKEEKADGEDELGEKTQNFRGGHWSEAKAQGNVSKILV